MNRALIELEQAEDVISEALGEYTYTEARDVFHMAAKVQGRLQTLPVYVWPVDRWVVSERHEGAHECGNCGALALKIGGPYGGEVLTRFCPHCGAELVGTEEADGEEAAGQGGGSPWAVMRRRTRSASTRPRGRTTQSGRGSTASSPSRRKAARGR